MLWQCKPAQDYCLVVRDGGEQKGNKLAILRLLSFFRLFMRLKRQAVLGRRICCPYISGGESNIMHFYVENKKADKITDCVINHRWFSDMPAETAEALWFGEEKQRREGGLR